MLAEVRLRRPARRREDALDGEGGDFVAHQVEESLTSPTGLPS
jgi:hypothetical protein